MTSFRHGDASIDDAAAIGAVIGGVGCSQIDYFAAVVLVFCYCYSIQFTGDPKCQSAVAIVGDVALSAFTLDDGL